MDKLAEDPDSEPEETPSPPPQDETIEGPDEQAKFDWSAPDPTPTSADAASTHALAGKLDELAYGAISGLHLSLAQLTGWEGWAFTPADEDAWRTLLRPALAGLDPKKWGLGFALMGVAMLETGRVVGYMRWRKAHAPAPVPHARPATVRPPSVEGGAPPEVRLGVPLQHAEDGL